jgi:curved DNA-binding protein CbpA
MYRPLEAMGDYSKLGPPDAVVRLVGGTDLTATGLSSVEGFVLSRIDGMSSMQTICLLTGLGEETTLDILTKLHDKGLILVGDEEPAPSPSPPLAPMDTVVDPSPLGLQVEEEPAVSETVEEPAPTDTAEEAPTDTADDEWKDSDTDEEVELKPEMRKRIRELSSALGQMTLFELFGVPPESDIKTIRKAFFAQSKIYHPDRYFGKKLGPYADMLHEIFKQMNAGYKMLCDKTKLNDYRQMVVQQREQERLARQVEHEAAREEEEERRRTDEHPMEEEEEEELDAPAGQYQISRPKKPVQPQPAEQAPARPAARASGAFRAHRAKALMDLVAHKRPHDKPAPSSSPAPPPSTPPDDRNRQKRRQTDHKIRSARVTGVLFTRAKKAKQFFAQGKAQLDRGQYLAATASLRLAMTYCPDEKEYAEAYEQASTKARELTADNYFKRGMMEESVGRFEAAASSFFKAAEQNPKPMYLVKAAEAMLWAHSADDLIKAKEYVTRAVQADPNSVDVRITAARVYKAAGMKRNARRELQQALKIEPNNPEAKELLKGV